MIRQLKLKGFGVLLVAAALLPACSSDIANAPEPQMWHVSIEANKPADDALTRGVYFPTNSTTLTSKWDDNQTVEIYNESDELVGTLYASASDDGSTVITGDISGTYTAGTSTLTLYSPSKTVDYSGQTGTLASMSSKDYVQSTITVTAVDGSNGLLATSSAAFTRQVAFTKFSVTPAVHSLQLSAEGQPTITATLDGTAEANDFYIAMPGTGTSTPTFTITGTTNANVAFTGTKSKLLENGKYYTASLNLMADISTFTLSQSNLSLTQSSATGSFTVTRDGDGEVTAVSSNPSVATVTVTNATSATATVTVTAIANGSATITVKCNQGANYTAYTATDKTCSVSASGFIIPPALGDKYYSDGTWGDNAHASGATVIGIVAWLGSDSALKCGKSHGLVMAKTSVYGTQSWAPYSAYVDEPFLTNTSSITGCQNNNKNGLTNTTNLVGDSHTHGAASAARNYTPAAPSTSGNTGWFLPSAAQWLAVMGSSGIGGYTGTFVWGDIASSSASVITNITNYLTASGVDGYFNYTSGFWTSTEVNDWSAVYVYFGGFSGGGVSLGDTSKSGGVVTHPFLAF